MLKTILTICFSVLITATAADTIYAEDVVYTLQEATAAALKTNERVVISEEDVFQAESRMDQARSYFFPWLTGRAGYTRYNDTLPAEGGALLFQPLEQSQAAIELTQPLYTGGRTLAAYRTAKTMTEMSKKQLSTSQQDIVMNVADAYYEVLKAKKLVDVSRDSLSRMEEYRKVTERVAKTRRTKANMSDLLRARTMVSQSGISVITSQDKLKIARQRLSLITKLPDNAGVNEPQTFLSPADTLEQLKVKALENRDDYAAFRLNQKVAEENITIVRGAHFPQLSAVGGIQYTESHPKMLTDATVYYGGIRLQIPIFEGGLMRAQVSEAKSKFRQAELASEQLRRKIETDVSEAYINLQTQTSVLETAKLQYADAKENFDAVTGLYGEGLASSLAVIDAQQALYVAERELVNSTYDQQLAILRLQKSIGLLGKGSEHINEGHHAAS